jgi:hypothetical protein
MQNDTKSTSNRGFAVPFYNRHIFLVVNIVFFAPRNLDVMVLNLAILGRVHMWNS